MLGQPHIHVVKPTQFNLRWQIFRKATLRFRRICCVKPKFDGLMPYGGILNLFALQSPHMRQCRNRYVTAPSSFDFAASFMSLETCCSQQALAPNRSACFLFLRRKRSRARALTRSAGWARNPEKSILKFHHSNDSSIPIATFLGKVSLLRPGRLSDCYALQLQIAKPPPLVTEWWALAALALKLDHYLSVAAGRHSIASASLPSSAETNRRPQVLKPKQIPLFSRHTSVRRAALRLRSLRTQIAEKPATSARRLDGNFERSRHACRARR